MKKSSITWHYRGSDPEWGCVFFLVWFFWGVDGVLLVGSSSVGSVRICWRITWRINGRLKVWFFFHAWGVFVMLMFVFYSPGGEEESGSEADCC